MTAKSLTRLGVTFVLYLLRRVPGKPQTYNKDQSISSFEDAVIKLRPHVSMKVLTTVGLMAWNSKGTTGVDSALAALEWSQSVDKTKWAFRS